MAARRQHAWLAEGCVLACWALQTGLMDVAGLQLVNRWMTPFDAGKPWLVCSPMSSEAGL